MIGVMTSATDQQPVLQPYRWTIDRYHQAIAAGLLEDEPVELLNGEYRGHSSVRSGSRRVGESGDRLSAIASNIAELTLRIITVAKPYKPSVAPQPSWPQNGPSLTKP